MNTMITLETGRLLLRMWREDDLEAYSSICADQEVMRYLGEGKTLNRAEAWRQMAMIIGHWHLRGYGIWAVEERETGRLVGRIGFFNPEGWPGFELGWVLGRDHWGKGYATEGARKALEHVFAETEHEHVISLIHPDNHGSISVARRLGEELERETEIFGHKVLVYGIKRTAR